MRRPRPGPEAPTWLYLLGRAPNRFGTLKIGVTSYPRQRMKDHATYPGEAILWVHFSAVGPRALMLEIERAAIRALARVGRRHSRHRAGEQFDGIEKEEAIRIVRAVADRVRATYAGLVVSRAQHVTSLAAWRAYRARIDAVLSGAQDATPGALDESEPEAA